MINFQGLKKPAFYAYQLLNRLGDEELKSTDTDSWATRSKNGVQILFWNFNPPKTDESNQVFYKKDIPTQDLGNANIQISDLSKGNYRMNIYQVGYQVNDVYADFLKLGSPKHLTREQVKQLAEKNNGKPIETVMVKIDGKQTFSKTLKLRENDVFLITLEKTN